MMMMMVMMMMMMMSAIDYKHICFIQSTVFNIKSYNIDINAVTKKSSQGPSYCRMLSAGTRREMTIPSPTALPQAGLLQKLRQ